MIRTDSTIIHTQNKATTTVREKLKKRAGKKYFTRRFVKELIASNPHSPLLYSYRETYKCSHTLSINEKNQAVSSYCKNRWCSVCNSNRTGKLIRDYAPVLEKMKNPYFITLTTQTVTKKELKSRIKDLTLAAQTILRKNSYKGKKNKLALNGIRKLEVTVRPNQRFHPHFHMIIEGKKEAEHIIKEWLKIWGDEASKKAQNIQKANKNSLKELFKYFTKMPIVKKDEKEKTNFISTDRKGNLIFSTAQDWDAIFQALRNKRIFQSFGNIKKIVEEVTEEAKIQFPENIEGKTWTWFKFDWISEYGECLTNYDPLKESYKTPIQNSA